MGSITVLHGSAYTVVRSTSQSQGDSIFFLGGGLEPQTPEPIDKKVAWVITSAMTSRLPKRKRTPHWGRGGVCVKYHPRVVFTARRCAKRGRYAVVGPPPF